MPLTQIALAADSIGSGEVGGFDYLGGGLGCYAEILAERLANFQTLGPLIGPGVRPVWRNNTTEWARVGSWTQTVSTDAFDRGLHGDAYYSSAGSGATNTWMKPTAWRPVVGFCVYWIDYAAGGDWQFSIDGGAWTNMGQARVGDNGLKKFYVASSVASTVAFRAHDGTAACGVLITDIEPFYVDPRTAGLNGFILHNVGHSSYWLSSFVQATSGDRLAWFDAVTLGTGNPPTNRPSVVIVGPFSNDCALLPTSTTAWSTNLQTIYNRVSSYATVAYVNCYEQGGTRLDGTVSTGTQQANYRAALKAVAAANGSNVVDLYDVWSAIGLVGFAACARFLNDTLHPNQDGHLDIATRLYGLLRATVYATQFANVQRRLLAGTSLVGGTSLLGGVPEPSAALTDSALGSDSIARTRTGTRSTADSGLGSDSVARALADSRTATDTALGSDTATRAASDTRTSSDSALGTDSVSRTRVATRTASDNGLGSDSTASSIRDARTATDQSVGSDLATRSVLESRAVADNALSSDSISRSLIAARAAADQSLGSDNTTRALLDARSATDVALGADTAARQLADTRTGTDSALGTDSATASRTTVRASTDQTVGNDTVTRQAAETRTSSDVSIGTDTTHGNQQRAVTDNTLGTDNATRGVLDGRTFADSALSADMLIRAFRATRTVTDDALGSDTVTTHTGHLVPFRNVAWVTGTILGKWRGGYVLDHWRTGDLAGKWHAAAVTE